VADKLFAVSRDGVKKSFPSTIQMLGNDWIEWLLYESAVEATSWLLLFLFLLSWIQRLWPAKQFAQEVRALLQQYLASQGSTAIQLHPSFPVDIRHNAKIFQQKLRELVT
jgi:hypothetical protein